MTLVIVVLSVALLVVLFMATGIVLGVWRHVRTPHRSRSTVFPNREKFIKTAAA